MEGKSEAKPIPWRGSRIIKGTGERTLASPGPCLVLKKQHQPCPAPPALQLIEDAQAALRSLFYFCSHAKAAGIRNATVQACFLLLKRQF